MEVELPIKLTHGSSVSQLIMIEIRYYERCAYIGTLEKGEAMCSDIATTFYKIITNRSDKSGYYISRCKEHPFYAYGFPDYKELSKDELKKEISILNVMES